MGVFWVLRFVCTLLLQLPNLWPWHHTHLCMNEYLQAAIRVCLPWALHVAINWVLFVQHSTRTGLQKAWWLQWKLLLRVVKAFGELLKCIYHVPKSTLGDRISGRVLPGATSGPPCYLTNEEEELVTFLCRVAQIGQGCTRQKVIAIIEGVLASCGNARAISSGWWTSFISRHPTVALRTPATLLLAWVGASDRGSLDNYFDELESTLEGNGLLH